MAGDGLRARGGARGAAPDPRAPPAGQRARVAAGAARLAAAARRLGRRLEPGQSHGQARCGRAAPRSSRRGCSLPDELDRPESALPRLRRRLRELADARRFEDAGRLRDRIAALERVCRELKRLDRVRRLECCVLLPAGEPGYVRALFVAGGRVAAERTLPPGRRRGARGRGRARGRAAVRESSTSTSSSSSTRSCAGRRRSCASRRSGARRSCVRETPSSARRPRPR